MFNGIWQVGRGFQVSGLFYTGIGERAATVYGGDLRGLGGGAGGQALRRQRLRPDGTIVPRNDFTQPARRRVDLRLQQRVPLPGRVAHRRHRRGVQRVQLTELDDHAPTRAAASTGQRIAGQNRTAQFGFRLTF